MPATALGNALLVPYVIIGLPLIALVLIDVADSRAEHTKLCVARCPCPSLRALIDENRFAALSLTLVSTTLLAAACISSFETSYTGEDNHGDMLYSTALFLCFATTTTIGCVNASAPRARAKTAPLLLSRLREARLPSPLFRRERYGEIAPRSPVSRATVCIYAFLTLAIFSMLVSEASSWWSRVTQEPPKTVEDAPDDSTALIEELV